MKINDCNLNISGDSNDKYFQHFNETGAYSDDVTSYLRALIQDDWVCFDVGANIGLTSIFMALTARDVLVTAFEPSPINFPYLMRNVNQNKFSNVIAVPIGLGDVPGFAEFYDIPGFSAGSHIKSEQAHPDTVDISTIPIKIETLDSYIAGTSISKLDLLKIDAEGFELNVLRGAAKTLKKFEPLVIIEFNSWFMVSVQKVDPYMVLDSMFAIFPILSVIRGQESTRIENTKEGKKSFIEGNTANGHVDNLVASFKLR
jgi:FkbM family methyltransferase